jgi:riboflavin transporter FmnP
MKAFKKGAIIGVVATFPLALICALLFRFPVPFAGYMSGPRAVFPVLIAVVFYGLLGGFLIQAVMGGLGGILAEHFSVTSRRDVKKIRIMFSSIGASFGVLVLAILDKLIGPW